MHSSFAFRNLRENQEKLRAPSSKGYEDRKNILNKILTSEDNSLNKNSGLQNASRMMKIASPYTTMAPLLQQYHDVLLEALNQVV